ncbi:hypothetical protein SLEP1_g15351 [Rubroshorea leprosula]|uniref:NB-ARC domain-containing protein n=1 Tax=Rubroshorea leprosula TaxID=152421 RepID=A0AAV5IT50_9ROSI|nr:hypothetical protein SLEP1_g15351 [Rubroshorea leprosula]
MEELRRVLGDLNNRLEDINLRKQNVETCSRKVVRREVINWLEKKKIEEVKELILQQGSFPDDIAIDQPPSSGMRLPAEDARGRTNVKEQIWGYLMEDDVRMIGVCGPCGIGKTTLMKNIHNDLLNESKFNKVIWATVPYPVSIVKLQDNIALNMQQTALENEPEEQHAATLSQILS